MHFALGHALCLGAHLFPHLVCHIDFRSQPQPKFAKALFGNNSEPAFSPIQTWVFWHQSSFVRSDEAIHSCNVKSPYLAPNDAYDPLDYVGGPIPLALLFSFILLFL